jgi:hypothetical protein
MTEDAYSSSGSRAGRETSGTTVGFILFAAIMMIMVGVFEAIQGLVGIFENEFYVATRNYLFKFDATTWGWIHLLLGLLVAVLGADLGAHGGDHPGRAQRPGQLLVHPLLPVLVAAPHHPEHLRDLGRGGPRRRAAGPGLTAASRIRVRKEWARRSA